MTTSIEGFSRSADPYQAHNVEQNLPHYLYEKRQQAEGLNRKIDILPNVSRDGTSSCPFAESLYHAAAQEAKTLEGCVPTGKQYLAALEGEIAKRHQELARIAADRNRLALEGPRHEYDKAYAAQKSRYEKVVQQRQQLKQLLGLIGRVLARAAEKKWPLGEPGDPRPAESAPSGSPSPALPPFWSPNGGRPDSPERGRSLFPGGPGQDSVGYGRRRQWSPNTGSAVEDLIDLGPMDGASHAAASEPPRESADD